MLVRSNGSMCSVLWGPWTHGASLWRGIHQKQLAWMAKLFCEESWRISSQKLWCPSLILCWTCSMRVRAVEIGNAQPVCEESGRLSSQNGVYNVQSGLWTSFYSENLLENPSVETFPKASPLSRLSARPMAPKKRTSGGAGGSKPKKGKTDAPGVPPDALALPHMKLFDDWASLSKKWADVYLSFLCFSCVLQQPTQAREHFLQGQNIGCSPDWALSRWGLANSVVKLIWV